MFIFFNLGKRERGRRFVGENWEEMAGKAVGFSVRGFVSVINVGFL